MDEDKLVAVENQHGDQELPFYAYSNNVILMLVV